MIKKYTVNLTEEELEKLRTIIRAGKTKARTITRARIILMSFEGKTDKAIAHNLGVNVSTVERTRHRLATGGIDLVLNERPHPPKTRKIDGEKEAFLIATACSKAPTGNIRWTLRLLAGRLVHLGIVDSISYETVRRTLKKTLV
jgi:transposase